MRYTIALSCFFLSGFAGLAYEVCWIRMASLVFGSTTLAVSTVLAVFFFGLAVGSYLFGTLSQKTERPLRLFAIMELGIAVFAVLSLWLFSALNSVYGVAFRSWEEHLGVLSLVRIGLVSLVLLPPTILMGGTLPLFCRQFVVSESRIAGSVGLLYGINTLGAAAGCAAAGFLFLPSLGVKSTVAIAVVLNVIVAVGVGTLGLRTRSYSPAREAAIDGAVAGRRRIIVLLLVFCSGFVALGNEVMWTRYLGLLLNNTVYTYTLTLTIVLVGIVIGSVLLGRRFDLWASPGVAFGVLQVASGLLVLVLMLLPPDLWRFLGQQFLQLTGVYGPVICGLLLLPPAVLAGASFPLAARLVVSDPALAGTGVGKLTAVNTLGGITGSLAVGFVVLPQAGLQFTLLFATGLSLLSGFAAWAFLSGEVSLRRRMIAIATACGIWLAIPPALGTRIPADFLGTRENLIDYREGNCSNVAVIHRGEHKVMTIDNYGQGSTKKNHLPMVAHHVLLMHPRPRRVLVVGVGAGQMARRLLMYGVEQLDCVDIEPAVFDMIREHYPSEWMDDPRVRLIGADGRNYVAHTDATYDIIAVEIGQVFRPGCAFFYTSEFYSDVRERLAPGGFACQFFSVFSYTDDLFRSALRTFVDVFPQSTLWYNSVEPILLGVKADRLEFDPSGLARLSTEGPIRSDLGYAHWGGPRYNLHHLDVFLASFLAGPSGLEAMTSGAPVLHDDRPVLDYGTIRPSNTLESAFEIFPLLRENREPVEQFLDLSAFEGQFDPRVVTEIREKNLNDLGAYLLVREAKSKASHRALDATEDMVRKALERNPESLEINRYLAEVLELKGDTAAAQRARATADRIERGDG